MVVGAFPIAKLSVLLIKQISKPIANACKERAKVNPFFRTYVCMPPAQFYNWCEVKAKMWILNLGRPVNIPVLSQEMAIELGANLLGEGIIFIIGAGLLIIEYRRQSKNEQKKESKREAEWKHVTDTLSDLFFTVQKQKTEIQELKGTIHILTTKYPIEPANKDKHGRASEPNETEDTPPAQNIHNLVRNFDDSQPVVATPYPNGSLILRSLNYLQMDVMSSSILTGTQRIAQQPISTGKKHPTPSQKQEPAVLTGALRDIENNFRSLF